MVLAVVTKARDFGSTDNLQLLTEVLLYFSGRSSNKGWREEGRGSFMVRTIKY